MSAFPPPVERLIQELKKLPGIGEKTAVRLAFHLLRTDRREVEALAGALSALHEATHFCSQCFGFTDADPCRLCADPGRSDEVICVVEEPADLVAIERSGQFRGRYHVLHGTLSPLDGVGPEDLRIAELVRRVGRGGVREVIVATNPTVEGEATAIYIAQLLKPLGIKVTRIARGLPAGGDVEYADSVTLGQALEGRREM